MRNITILFILILINVACSKNDDTTIPDDNCITEEDAKRNKLINAIEDSDDLNLITYGPAYINNDTFTFGLGIKSNKLWCGFFEETNESIFVQKYVFTSKENFTDTIKIVDKGYGERDTFLFNDASLLYVKGTDLNNFFIHTNHYNIFVENGNIYYRNYKNIGIDLWLDWYFMEEETYRCWIVDKQGNKIYEIVRDAIRKTPLSLYYYLDVLIDGNTCKVSSFDAKTGEAVWETCIFNLSNIIDGHYHNITEYHTVKNSYIDFEFHIVNYDGTKEKRERRINIETGEMTQGENITIESGTGLGGNVKPVENQ